MLGWRIFLLGVFLVPFARLTPVQGLGFSVSDALLIAGGLLVLAQGGRLRLHSGAWWFVVPGAVLVCCALLAGVLVDSSGRAALSHAIQYGYGLILIPLVLAQQGLSRIITAIYALTAGLTASVVLGSLIIGLSPGTYSTLLQLGFMDAKAGREGLFAGVGELSKMSSMAIPLAYLLAVSGRVTALKGAALVAAPFAALVLARSGAATLGAGAALVVLGAGHLIFRSRIRGTYPSKNSSRALLVGVLGAAVGLYAIRRLDQSGGQYFAEFSARVATPLQSEGISEVGSAEGRAAVVGEAWQMLGDVPFFGIGAEQFSAVSDYNTSVHVVPLNLWIELGILALLAWVVLMLVSTMGVLASGGRDPLVAVAASAVGTAFLFANLSLPYLYLRPVLLPAVLACMAAAAASRPATPAVDTVAAVVHEHADKR